MTLPIELTRLPQFVLWRRQKDTKVPYSALTGKPASSTRREDWTSYTDALAAFAAHPNRFAGIGFVFSADDNLCGIDFDDCLDNFGHIKPWAATWLERLAGYQEISPSGKGVKVWVLARLAGGGIKSYVNAQGKPVRDKSESDGAIEIYDRGRYFTITGKQLGDGRPEPADQAISDLAASLRAPSTPQPVNGAPVVPINGAGALGKGNRHTEMVRVAASCRARGLGLPEITAALQAYNREHCHPPKPDREVADIAKWAADRPAGQLPELPEAPAGSAEAPQIGDNAPWYAETAHRGEKLYPNDIARLIMRDHLFMRVMNGMVYRYNKLYWQQTTEEAVKALAMQYDTHEHGRATRRNEVASYVLTAGHREGIRWRQLAEREVPVQNGVLDVETCDIRPHRPGDFLESCIPHEYSPKNRCHRWLKVIARWFKDDPDADAKVDALQEFFGYCLLPHASYKKALFCYGESDTGKSVVPQVLRMLVGPENTCSISTEEMADARKREDIVGKALNLLTELPSDALISDGGFKQLVSTGDAIAIDPKYHRRFTYVPYAKHVVCCNNLPAISDHSRATFNRLLILNFNNVIPKAEQDKQLNRVLAEELPGILAWAVEGAARLIQNNGDFTEIEESAQTLEDYRRSQNPMNDFIAEQCTVTDPDEFVTMPEFRDRFWKWSGKPTTSTRVSRMLTGAGFEIKVVRFIGKPTRAVIGLRLNG